MSDVRSHGIHGADSLLHLVLSFGGFCCGLARHLGGADGVSCYFFYRRGHLIDGSGSLLDFVVLADQPTCAVFGHCGQFFSGGGQLVGSIGDLLHGSLEVALHVGQRRQQLPRFILACRVYRVGQITLSDAAGARDGVVKRTGDHAGDQQSQTQCTGGSNNGAYAQRPSHLAIGIGAVARDVSRLASVGIDHDFQFADRLAIQRDRAGVCQLCCLLGITGFEQGKYVFGRGYVGWPVTVEIVACCALVIL